MPKISHLSYKHALLNLGIKNVNVFGLNVMSQFWRRWRWGRCESCGGEGAQRGAGVLESCPCCPPVCHRYPLLLHSSN